MPCALCGTQGHNRRTCQQWQVLEASRQAEEQEQEQEERLHTPRNMITNIHFDISYSPSTRNRTPITSINETSILFETPTIDRIMPRALFQDLSSIDNLFLDTDSDLDSLPELISPDLLDYSMDKQIYPPLVSCVEKPCHTTDCPICMEDLKKTDVMVTRCGHQFHGTCMLRHMKIHDNCPMCRGVLFTKANVY